MSFIERLKQGEAAEAQRVQQLKTQQEAREKERLQRQAVENERRAKRKEQAEKFREESGVGLTVDELVKFLETPTIPVARTSFSDGLHSSWTEYIGRGSRGIRSRYTEFVTSDGLHSTSYGFPFSQRDPDSAFDTVHWDTADLGFSKAKVMGSDTHHSEKYLAVETCPNGTIVFHAGWFGGTTIGLAEWRAKDKGQLFEKALEKAYKNPGINRYSVWHQPVSPGFG